MVVVSLAVSLVHISIGGSSLPLKVVVSVSTMKIAPLHSPISATCQFSRPKPPRVIPWFSQE